jgi:uncharacterized protein DUF5132
MALIEDLFKGGNIVTGLAIGVGATVIAPLVTPILRPIAKTAIKAGLAAYDQGRAAFSELSEATGDIVAEAREEMAPAAPEMPAKRSSPSPKASS